MKILDKIFKAVGYDPDDKAGQLSGNGNSQDENIKPEPSGYAANENVAMPVNPDGGKRTIDTQTTESDIHDALRENMEAERGAAFSDTLNYPQKRKYRDIDSQLQNQYFSGMK
ncbi:MAG: hypothetical protein FIB08_03690 [Candidatus Methanoperedens sp.]|nr:hypothetical protein [Candidatus Methanoperedens sp.]